MIYSINRPDTYLCIWYIFLTFVNNKTHHIIILRLKTTREKETILKVFFCMLQKVHKKCITMTWNSMSNSTHLVPPQSGDINILYDTHYLIHVELGPRNENLDLLKTQKFTGLGLRGRTSDHREDCLPDDGCSGWASCTLD